MRVEIIGRVDLHTFLSTEYCQIPLFLERVSAGFPSPAQDYIEQALDLNQLCITHPAATFFVRVQGDSMHDAGIFTGDILVVDRSLSAKSGDIVIASLHGEMTVKELGTSPSPCLIPRNSAYPVIPINDETEVEIFGVVTNVIRQVKRSR